MSSYLVYFLLFALFILVVPLGISPFEAPKVVVAEIIIALLLLIKIFHFKKANLKTNLSSQSILLFILLILALDQLIIFRDFSAFFSNPFRLQGVFLFINLLIFSLISKDINIRQIPSFFYYLSFAGLMLSTLVLGVNQNLRAFGTLGEPNALAATSLFFLPFVYFKSKKLTKILFILATFLVILLSGSRAGLIGFFMELAFLLLTFVFKFSLKKAVFGVMLLILLSLSLPFNEKVGLLEVRSQVWQVSFGAGLKSPILGWGFGNIQQAIKTVSVAQNNPIQYLVVDSAHNFILDFWVQSGLVGVICILTLIALSFDGLIKQQKVLQLTAFLGIITAMLFNPVSVVNLLAFWWLIGQGIDTNKV